MPDQLQDAPDLARAVDRESWRARQLFEAGKTDEALEVLESVLHDVPEHTDAHRVRQDILRRRGRMGLLLWESERRLTKQPNSGERVIRTTI